MVTFALCKYDTGCVILDTLKPLEFDIRKAGKKGIVIIQS